MPSPIRRSARSAPLPPTKPAQPPSIASSSSLSSARHDRHQRATLPALPPSLTPHSRSSEDASESPRRSRRAPHPVAKDGESNHNAAAAANGGGGSGADTAGRDSGVGGEEDEEGEEEVTRCVCGHAEYPGPPLSEAFSRSTAADDADTESTHPPEDAGALFISCDGCSVWQHGGCVSIVADTQVPEKYFCERCRPKMHELRTDARGQNYSRYQPGWNKPHRTGKPADKPAREQDPAARASADPITGRRRATMRSKEHDDEDAQLLRAIEESKREAEGRKNGKRSREESQDTRPNGKRPRNESESVAPAKSHNVSVNGASDDDRPGTAAGKSKKARAEAAQTARQAEMREKEKERERARAEAAGRRQERAGRRRLDDEGNETSKPTVSAVSSPPADTPLTRNSPAPPPAGEKVSHKKGAGGKVKKLGNNQYTKLRESQTAAASATTTQPSGTSGDEQPQSHPPPPSSQAASAPAKPSPPDRNHKSRLPKGKGKAGLANGNTADREPPPHTLAAMSRSVDAMAAFVRQARSDLGGGWEEAATTTTTAAGRAGGDEVPWEAMSAAQMAAVVERSIEQWREQFGGLAA